jgi:hypothetical protein
MMPGAFAVFQYAGNLRKGLLNNQSQNLYCCQSDSVPHDFPYKVCFIGEKRLSFRSGLQKLPLLVISPLTAGFRLSCEKKCFTGVRELTQVPSFSDEFVRDQT